MIHFKWQNIEANTWIVTNVYNGKQKTIIMSKELKLSNLVEFLKMVL